MKPSSSAAAQTSAPPRIVARSRIRPAMRLKVADTAPDYTPTQIVSAPATPTAGGANSNWRDDGSYVVEKGKPPSHTRWQKGQSGNPRGKTKGTPNNDTIVVDLMDGQIPVKTASGEKRMSRKAALFHRFWEKAAKGDLQAAKFLFDRYSEAQGRKAEKEVAEEALSEVERDELAAFIATFGFGIDDETGGRS